MSRIWVWALRGAALCCAGCALYGMFVLFTVAQKLHAGATEVRVLLDRSKPEYSLPADTTPISAPESGADGLLRFKHYETAVFHGINEEILAKGAGHIPASAEPNTKGNCVLYGHRDSAFRFLEKLRVGDEVQLWSRTEEKCYRVTEVLIVEPDDPVIFTQTETVTLSLVTCYPFTFVGPALQRCVVRAVATQPNTENLHQG